MTRVKKPSMLSEGKSVASFVEIYNERKETENFTNKI